MKHLDLFSGIGGFALAVDTVWPGSEHVFCDNSLFCQAVLKKHWPQSKIYGDIRSVSKEQFVAGSRSEESNGLPKFTRKESVETWDIDILTGGFPCQPFSQAGRRKGTDDDRYLWPEMLRVIREFKPTWVIAENVRGLLTWNEGLVFEQVCADLENEGYEIQAFIIPAVAVNAPHRRDRVWFVACCCEHRGGRGQEREAESISGIGGKARHIRGIGRANKIFNATDTKHSRLERGQCKAGKGQRGFSDRICDEEINAAWNQNWHEVATELCTVDDGLPNGLARPRGWRNAALKGAGNAIVPQIAIEIMRAIKNA